MPYMKASLNLTPKDIGSGGTGAAGSKLTGDLPRRVGLWDLFSRMSTRRTRGSPPADVARTGDTSTFLEKRSMLCNSGAIPSESGISFLGDRSSLGGGE